MILASGSATLPLVRQVACLGAALAEGTAVRLEREWQDKSAGLRTHTIVCLGATLFMVISKYGFADVLAAKGVQLDPSRVAAQIVSGIGFLGAGVIFVNRNTVKGLTTAATIWLTAAIGAADGAGLLPLAALATVGYLLLAVLYRLVDDRLIDRAREELEAPDGDGGG